jgi:fibronectin type 3 domain-containing protein
MPVLGPVWFGYNVHRGSVSGGPYSRINSALEVSTTYTDYTVAAGQTHYYVTTAVNASSNESG